MCGLGLFSSFALPKPFPTTVADQFDESKPAQARLIPSFFNYFYAVINGGAIISATGGWQ